MWYWQKESHTATQENRVQKQEYKSVVTWFGDEGAKAIQWEEERLYSDSAGTAS